MQMNEITFAGNVGADAQLKQSQDGSKSWISFTVAHSEKQDGKPDRTTWAKCSVFGKWTEYARHIKRGDNVIVRGKASASAWIDKKTNQAVAGLDIMPFQIGIINKNPQATPGEPRLVEQEDFEIPF